MDPGDCLDADGWLAARAAGTLEVATGRRLERHLAACAGCRDVARDLEAAEPVSWLFPPVSATAYELGPVLGYGGMGRIRRAIDRRLGREVAIKELLFHTDELAARFVREARIAASLQHPNIVPIYEVGTWPDGTPFYAMRLVAGRSLADALASRHSLRERLALIPSLIAAADAVAFAHASGVVHRDLTPGNLLLGDFGETLVIDWGLAKELRARVPRVAPEYQTGVTEQVLTSRGDVIGSPAYMPVEQARGEPTDLRADVYALGAILYHLIAGRAPYSGRSARRVLARVRAEEPVPIEKHTPEIPATLRVIVRTAMAREAAGRYASAGELVAALRKFATDALADTRQGLVARWLGRAA